MIATADEKILTIGGDVIELLNVFPIHPKFYLSPGVNMITSDVSGEKKISSWSYLNTPVIQQTLSYQPTLLEDYHNGHDFVNFSGNSQFLIGDANVCSIDDTYHAFIVAAIFEQSGTGTRYIAAKGVDNFETYNFGYTSASAVMRGWVQAEGTSGITSNSSLKIFSYVIDRIYGKLTYRINGITDVSVGQSVNNISSNDNFYLGIGNNGSSFPFRGKLGDFFLIDDPAQLEPVENYLMTKYAL